MSNKRHQLSILDQWASQSSQVSRSTERLQEIAGWIDWQPLYEVGRRIDKTDPQGGQLHKPVRWMIRGLFGQHLSSLATRSWRIRGSVHWAKKDPNLIPAGVT